MIPGFCHSTYPNPWVPWIHHQYFFFLIVHCPNQNEASRKAGILSVFFAATCPKPSPGSDIYQGLNKYSTPDLHLCTRSILSHLLKGIAPLILPLLYCVIIIPLFIGLFSSADKPTLIFLVLKRKTNKETTLGLHSFSVDTTHILSIVCLPHQISSTNERFMFYLLRYLQCLKNAGHVIGHLINIC